jgi:hypothetical protein
MHNFFQARVLFVQRLGPVGFVPNIRLLQRASNLLEALVFILVVKGTPSGRRRAP